MLETGLLRRPADFPDANSISIGIRQALSIEVPASDKAYDPTPSLPIELVKVLNPTDAARCQFFHWRSLCAQKRPGDVTCHVGPANCDRLKVNGPLVLRQYVEVVRAAFCRRRRRENARLRRRLAGLEQRSAVILGEDQHIAEIDNS